MRETLRIAAAQYLIEEPNTFPAYLAKLSRWVDDGARGGNHMLVFPEYAGAEAMAVFGREANADLLNATRLLQDIAPQIDLHLSQLARSRGLYILGPSLPRLRDEAFVNEARFFGPSGHCIGQEKMILTPFDREQWHLSAGQSQSVIETAFGKIAIAICYDIEFPNQVRALTEAGAEIILCPSCTDTLSGYWRVRVGAMARALESQCFVVQAPIVGVAAWSEALDINIGAAGVFAPPDMAVAPEGILALGELNRPGWLDCALDLSRLHDIRERGEVRTWQDWPKQARAPVSMVRLD
jgi:predicted amidohydrolase